MVELDDVVKVERILKVKFTFYETIAERHRQVFLNTNWLKTLDR